MIREPASAAAASICWMARWQGQGREYTAPATARHPRPCGWCDYPAQTLMDWIQEFNELDLIPGRDPEQPNGHTLARSFMQLTRERQRDLVDAALYPEGVPA